MSLSLSLALSRRREHPCECGHEDTLACVSCECVYVVNIFGRRDVYRAETLKVCVQTVMQMLACCSLILHHLTSVNFAFILPPPSLSFSS